MVEQDKTPRLEIVRDSAALAKKMVEIFLEDSQKAIADKGIFYAALSGGQTPLPFFERLGSLGPSKQPDWQKVHLFWVDERYVPEDSPFSNYRSARKALLDKISIPPQNIHRIPTEHNDIGLSARMYGEEIRRTFSLQVSRLPCFDLILLGMGADGHTASLFPGYSEALNCSDLAYAVYVQGQGPNRITLSGPVLRAASHLVVMVSGSDKAQIIRKVFSEPPDEMRYPIHTLWPVLEKVTWLLDETAAKLLQS